MTPNQKWFIGCLGLAVIALFGALGAFAFLQIPDVAEQLPPNSSPITVTLKTPLNGANVPMDAFTTVTADSNGAQSITALELWVDGALLKTQAAPAGAILNPFNAFWTWTPASQGEYTLFVRAMDASKSIGTSNVVHVTATKDANADATANYKTQSGDTLSDLALQFHTTPQEIVDLNPQINSNNPITSGQNISVPIPLSPPPTPNPPPEAQPAPPPVEPPPASDGQPNNFSFWINKNILNYFSVPLLPVSPGLAKKEDGCNVKLFITDNSNNEDGFFVYRADANSQVFKRIATLGSQNGTGAFTYVDSNVYGPLAYYVASFTTAGESPSQYVQAEITNAACLISPWQMIQLNQAKLVVQQPVDKVYCYLSTNNEPWTRVPPVPNTFIFPQNGEFDVSEYIKTLMPTQVNGPVTLDLECWGWVGGTLTFLGEAKETFLPTPKPLPIKIKFGVAKFDITGNLFVTQVMSGTVPNGKVTPPFNLTGTTDPVECAAHYPPGQIPDQPGWCSEQITSQKLILVWDWNPNSIFICTKGPCVTTIKNIDGYKLYGFGVYPDDTQVNRTLVATFTPANSKGYATYPFPGVCYAVRAFAGPIESVDSNVFCPPPDSYGAKTVKLKLQQPPNGLSQRFAWYWKKPFSVSLDPYGIRACGPGEDQVCVGFDWLRDLDSYDELQTYYQGAVRFDLNPILNKPVVKAILRYRRLDGSFVVANDAGNGMSCAQTLGIGTTNWKDHDGVPDDQDPFVPLNLYKTLSTNLSYAPYAIDVTSIVANWANGSDQNNGFILHGIAPFGPPGEKYENQCTTTYGDFELEVTFGK